MVEKVLSDIIHLCLLIDKKAVKAYREMAQLADRDGLREFWKHMAEEEERHTDYWKTLINFSENNLLPQVFDEPYTVRDELKRINSKVDNLLMQLGKSPTLINSFLLAYRLEFYLIHPAFRVLFHVLKSVKKNERTPEDDYELHIDSLIEALTKYGKETPELELIGEAILRFWKENKELFIQSNMDSVAGILNRRGFTNTVKPLANLAQRNKFNVGIMFIDIDDFKKINDTHGHKTGDKVIKRVADILKSRLRSSDVIGRYGGDEFIVYLSSVKDDSLSNIANDLRSRIESGYIKNVPVTVSIGVSHGLFKEKTSIGKRLERLIKKADDCLYQAKNIGRNKIVISTPR